MNEELGFKIEVVNVIFDTVVVDIQSRFKILNETVDLFDGLPPTTLQTSTDEVLNEVSKRLYNEYLSIITPSFRAQLVIIRGEFEIANI